jgi:hypothetical protein
MDRIGRVLWETGEGLKTAVGEVFGALKCDVTAAPGTPGLLAVKLGDSRRLLVLVSGGANPLQKTSEELAHAFQAVQFAAADDRVLLVPNNDPASPPSGRPAPVLPDALGVLQRMGVNVATTATLFALWLLSNDDQAKTRKALERLHTQDGGSFAVASR